MSTSHLFNSLMRAPTGDKIGSKWSKDYIGIGFFRKNRTNRIYI